MSTRSAYQIMLFVISFFMVGNFASAQDNITEKAAKAWIKNKTWNSGLTQNVQSSVDAVEFYKQYHANKATWDKAFAYFKSLNLETIVPGRYNVDGVDGGNIYALVTDAPSKELEQTGWESHRKYIDLQYVIRGKEQIEVAPLNSATVTNEYNEANDVAHYTATGTRYTADPETFYLFFPNDVHRPTIKVNGFDTVKKLVIKIHVAQ